MAAGRLYVVSTPIGNLADITLRALEVLRTVSLILAEDTRHARVLLARYDITTATAAYHEHNEARATPALVDRLAAGEDLALISDAGTPLLSDPGGRLIRATIDAGLAVVPVPGPSALLAALVASGLPADRFTFFGFLPRRGAERRRALADVAELGHVAVLYEAPGRTAQTLTDLAVLGVEGRRAVVARELTKQFEEVRRGTIAEMAAYYAGTPPRGEVVILIEGAAAPATDPTAWRTQARALRATGASAREIMGTLMRDGGAPRNAAYRIAHEHEAHDTDSADPEEPDEGEAGGGGADG